MENVICYFSGTGNSKHLANVVASCLGDCEVLDLATLKDAQIDCKRFGIVSPVYFWGLPKIVQEHLPKIQLKKNTYCFGIINYGGSAGVAMKQMRAIFESMGNPLQLGFGVKMPENYIVDYPVQSEPKQKKIIDAAEQKMKNYATMIQNKESGLFKGSSYIIDGLGGKALNKSFVKKVEQKDQGFHVEEQCSGCGLCEKTCPVGNIKITDGVVTWQHHCEFCMKCIQTCPKEAIQYKNKTKKRARYQCKE